MSRRDLDTKPNSAPPGESVSASQPGFLNLYSGGAVGNTVYGLHDF